MTTTIDWGAFERIDENDRRAMRRDRYERARAREIRRKVRRTTPKGGSR